MAAIRSLNKNAFQQDANRSLFTMWGGALCQRGVSRTESPTRDRNPLDRDPPIQRPPNKDPPRTEIPGRDPLKGTWDQRQRPPWEGIWYQAARQEVTLYRGPLPTMDRMTDMCKNITLPQTSFAGGKYGIFIFSFFFDNV